MSSSSHHVTSGVAVGARSPTTTGKFSEVTLSGGGQTYESFGSRTVSVKTVSVVNSKPPSPTLVANSGSFVYQQAATGSAAASASASASASNSAAVAASDSTRLTLFSGKICGIFIVGSFTGCTGSRDVWGLLSS